MISRAGTIGKYIAAVCSTVLLVFSQSCSEVNNMPRPEKLIPERDLAAILTEATLADGLLSLPGIRDKYLTKDSVELFISIISRYGYSKDDMDKSLEYYFIKKPKRLIKIYDRVIEEMKKMEESTMTATDDIERRKPDMWKGSQVFNIPDTSGIPDTRFSIRVVPPGTYTLSFTVTLYPSDQSFSPSPVCWTVNADSADTGRRYYVPLVRYIADGITRDYVISGSLGGRDPVFISGDFFQTGSDPGCFPPSATIENISFSFSRHMLER